jgi:hypothetical protein
MKSKIILTASAVFLFAAGLILDFLPQEIAATLNLGSSAAITVLMQVLAAAFLGMGFMNWLSKSNPMGGIYSRPLALQNFLFFGVAAIALDKVALHGGTQRSLQSAAIAFTIFALTFGWLLFFHDPIGKSKQEQPLT